MPETEAIQTVLQKHFELVESWVHKDEVIGNTQFINGRLRLRKITMGRRVTRLL